MAKSLTLAALLSALPLSANPTVEDPFPGKDLVGVQARVSVPAAGLARAVGVQTPGAGASIQAELHLAPYRFDRDLERACVRLGLGADAWHKLPGTPGRSVTAWHVDVDGLYFLWDDGREWLNGPYLVAGAKGMAWTVGPAASSTGTQELTVRAGFTAGFGYRLNRRMDAELTFLGSRADPGIHGVGAVVVGLDCWF